MLTLPQLVAHLHGLVAPPTPEEMARLLDRLVPDPRSLEPHTRFDPGRYCRNPVADGPHFQILVICWCRGQRSPIHDHAGSTCGVRVISGTAAETLYDVSDPTRPRPSAARRLGPGAVTASSDRDAHRLAAEEGPLVTLHVYMPPLSAMTLYPDETPRPALQSWTRDRVRPQPTA